MRALSAYFSKTVSPEEPPHHAVTPAPASVAVPVVVVASQTMVTIRSKPICSGRILRIANSNINAHFLPPKKSFGAFLHQVPDYPELAIDLCGLCGSSLRFGKIKTNLRKPVAYFLIDNVGLPHAELSCSHTLEQLS